MKNAFFDQIGVTAAQLRTSRHSDTPQINTPHSRRRISLNTYELRPDVNRNTRGVPILNLVQIDGVNEKITSMISAGNFKDYLDST